MAQSSSELGTWCDAGHSPTGFDSPCEHVKVDHSSTIQRQSSGVQTIMPVQGNLNSMSNPVNTKRKMSAFSEIRKQATSWVQQHATPICRRGTAGKPKGLNAWPSKAARHGLWPERQWLHADSLFGARSPLLCRVHAGRVGPMSAPPWHAKRGHWHDLTWLPKLKPGNGVT